MSDADTDCPAEVTEPLAADVHKPLVPMWEAMDCPDVTDDPWYDPF